MQSVIALQVGAISVPGVTNFPGDFGCYRRAERMPAAPNCVPSGRATLLADSSTGASDAAAEAASALAAAAALLQATDAPFASDALKSARALYDFSRQITKKASSWSVQVARTYPTTSGESHRLWAAAMLAWVHRCDAAGVLTCNTTRASMYYNDALVLWKEVKVCSLPLCCSTSTTCSDPRANRRAPQPEHLAH
jgi:hypothetical protein